MTVKKYAATIISANPINMKIKIVNVQSLNKRELLATGKVMVSASSNSMNLVLDIHFQQEMDKKFLIR